MKVIHVNHSDALGGAARAAFRIHQALWSSGVDSSMRVSVKTTDAHTVESPGSSLRRKLGRLRPTLGALARTGFRTDNPVVHSAAAVPSLVHRELNRGDADIVHLHWVGLETLSIEDIGRIRKPVVWTLHDMWAFCGAEHYAPETGDARFRVGYRADNRPHGESGWDLNRWTWNRKRRAFKRPMTIVCSSRWLAECAQTSHLFRDWRIEVIPYPIDTEQWRPLPQAEARDLMRLPPDGKLVLFGAIGGERDSRKGAGLLRDALRRIHCAHGADTQLAVFGQSAPLQQDDLPFAIHYLGHLHDDISLALAYSAADVMVVPSRQEAFGQTASEAHACGTPVVAFRVGGLKDIVEHKETGYLAEPFDSASLAEGISWVLADENRRRKLGEEARLKVERSYAPPAIASRYLALYRDVLARR